MPADVGRRQPLNRVNCTNDGRFLNLSAAFADVKSLSMRRMNVFAARELSAASTEPIAKMLINKQRKAETMVTPTPLRLVAIEESLQAEDDGRADPITEQDLVAIEESPPAGDDGSANPVAMMTEHDAITRRVPDPANVAARKASRTVRSDSPGGRLCCPSLRSASCSGWLSLRWRRSEGAHPLPHPPALPVHRFAAQRSRRNPGRHWLRPHRLPLHLLRCALSTIPSASRLRLNPGQPS